MGARRGGEKAQGLSDDPNDATYLELALRHGLPLATLDDELAAAATVAGVPAYKPT